MIEFTAKEFKKQYGHKPGDFFDLTKHLTPQHKIDCMRNPKIAIKMAEFGLLNIKGLGLNYMLVVRWWIDGGRIRGKIDNVTIFHSKGEMVAYRSKIRVKEVKLNEN